MRKIRTGAALLLILSLLLTGCNPVNDLAILGSVMTAAESAMEMDEESSPEAAPEESVAPDTVPVEESSEAASQEESTGEEEAAADAEHTCLFPIRETVSPACTEEGYYLGVCLTCGQERKTVIPATGHHIVQRTADPTCTEAGYDNLVCSRCGYVLSGTDIPATGHSLSQTVITPATCTTDGKGAYFCCNCDYSEYYTISATGHDPVETYIVEPTCEEAGIKQLLCSRCGLEMGEQEEVAALGHSFYTRSTDYGTYQRCDRCNSYKDIETTIDQSVAAAQFLALLNDYRAENGLEPLVLDPTLCSIATERAQEITENYSHDGFRGAYGEIIAASSTIESCFAAWQTSPGHNELMLYDSWGCCGMGVCAGMYRGYLLLYCVALFSF